MRIGSVTPAYSKLEEIYFSPTWDRMATPNTPDERGPLIAGYMYKLSMSGLMKVRKVHYIRITV